MNLLLSPVLANIYYVGGGSVGLILSAGMAGSKPARRRIALENIHFAIAV